MTQIQTRPAVMGVAGVLLAAIANFSPAQVVSPSAPAQASPATTVDEVVVTAQRRSQDLEKVPIAVTAFTAAQLDDRVSLDSTQLLEFVPNVLALNQGGQPSQANYYFRGVGTPDGLQTFNSPVTTYLDEVPLGRISGANLNFLDISQIEVLRGPQGTLFGQNVTGGAILYTSRKPASEFGISAQVEGGTREHVDARTTIDVPLAGNLFTSFTAYALHEDGYLHDVYNGSDLNGQKDYGFRGAIRYLPTSDIEWNVALDYSLQDGSELGVPGKINVPNAVFVPGANNARGTFFGDFNLIDSVLANCEHGNNPLQWVENGCQAAISTNSGLTSNLRYAISDHLAVNLITGIRKTIQDFGLDFIGDGPQTHAAFEAYILANSSNFEQYSQEIKFTGDAWDERFKYVGGLFYFHEDDHTQLDTFFNFPAVGYVTNTDVITEYLNNHASSYAAYFQADIKILDPLTLTLGYRYTLDREAVGIEFISHSFLYQSFDTPEIAGPPRISASRGTPKVGLEYQLTPEVMTYVSYTEGVKAGGWSGRASAADAFTAFGDEKVKSYEVGVRSKLFDDRLRLNATLFRADYSALQINTGYELPNGQPVFVYGNAGDGYDQGLELESQFVIAQGLLANFNLGYQDSAYTYLTPLSIVSLGLNVGDHLALTPPVTLSSGLSWTRNWEPIKGALTLTGNFQFLPHFNPTVSSTSAETESIFILNAQVAYKPDNSHFEFALECRNCTFKEYLPDPNHAGGGELGTVPFAGVRLKYKL